MKRKHIIIPMVLVVLLAFGALSFNPDNKNFEISKQLSIFAALFREVNMFYVDEKDPGDIMNSGINSMLRALDPYTVYYPESQMEDVKLMTTGEYAGIGAIISKKDDYVMIRQPYRNSPAAKAGLVPGDLIIAIDGNNIKEKSVSDVSEMLKGQPGKDITLRIKRDDKEIDFKFIREKIQMPSVPFYGMADNATGYINFNSFIQNSGVDVRKAILDLKNQGATSLILDLRGNGGGLLDQAVEISNFFLPRGSKIVSTKSRVSQMDKEYEARNNPIVPDMPLAVLIDRSSASASEIVSGALQDYDRAVLIGERSLGKGLVQSVKDLPYNTKIKITTAKYYIPSGRSIQEIDYSHRNPDGTVSKVADSLISEFSTAAGRKVYDGGGIQPDIKIEAPELPEIVKELVINDYIFDFVNNYAHANPTIPSPSEFRITDDIYNQFKNFLKERDFSYETASQQILEKLVETAKSEKYFDISKTELEKLKSDFGHSIDRDAELFREEITMFLAEQFMQRYYFSEGVIEYGLHHDEEIEKAIEILGNREEYNRILNK